MTMKDKRVAYEQERKAMNEWAKKDLDHSLMIESIHQEALRQIVEKIDSFYLRYANASGLTRAEAKRVLKNFDIRQWETKAKQAVQDKDFSPETNQWLKTYNAKMRISRFEALKMDLELELMKMCAEDNQLMDKVLIEGALAEAKRQAGILGISGTSVKKDLERIVDADFYGEAYSNRIWARTGIYGSTRKALFSGMNRMFVGVSDYKQVRRQLMKSFKTSQYETDRLLRTELQRVRCQTQQKMYEENGFTHYIWTAEPGACPYCADLDGHYIEVGKGTLGETIPPVHPNCRCSTFGHIEMTYKDGRSTLDDFERWESKTDEDAGIIKADKVIKGHKPPPKTGEPNSVVQHEKNDTVINRTYYNE